LKRRAWAASRQIERGVTMHLGYRS
jgi:hypothetical protein